MKFSMLSKNISKIEWTDYINNDEVLRKYISNVEYIQKDNIKYKCATHHLTPVDYGFLMQELNLSKLI